MMMLLAVFYYWLSVDGCYWLYWSITNPDALDMRPANFFASDVPLLAVWIIWLYQGSMRDLIASVRSQLTRQR